MVVNYQSLFVVADVLDLVVVIVEKSTKIELVVVLCLELDGVSLLCPLLLEYQLHLSWIVVYSDCVPLVVAEGDHCVVFCRID